MRQFFESFATKRALCGALVAICMYSEMVLALTSGEKRDPTSYSWLTYAWVVLLASWGGVVNFMRKVRTGVARPFNVAEFIGELATSAFVGVITFWLCEMAMLDPLLSAALVGISGHMGSRAIFHLEEVFKSRFPAYRAEEEDGRNDVVSDNYSAKNKKGWKLKEADGSFTSHPEEEDGRNP